MEHRRPEGKAPGPGGGLTADERARAAGTADPGVAGDTHVAGPAPKPPVMDAPGPATAPPATAPPPTVPAKPSGRTERSEQAKPSAQAAQSARAERSKPAASPGPLLDPAEAERFRERWREVQSGFVDDPGEAVRRADGLASDAVDALGRAIAAHRRSLAEDSAKDGRPDTERLRLALHGYRDLLNRVIDA
ncbi:hypothetical protein E1287_02240 [Actinomadura sp. KC06]|uniref:hypothetical protein n=1 Tax=Actinomadura sp. KC06 TaxID=2530369 RepID=UPI00104B48A6|nr:hypothetical protein [Actinomadura sp. KC06]TDD40010.1 hypothetical protein E1287_02240 [Actinomadura sp. KC06]